MTKFNPGHLPGLSFPMSLPPLGTAPGKSTDSCFLFLIFPRNDFCLLSCFSPFQMQLPFKVFGQQQPTWELMLFRDKA